MPCLYMYTTQQQQKNTSKTFLNHYKYSIKCCSILSNYKSIGWLSIYRITIEQSWKQFIVPHWVDNWWHFVGTTYLNYVTVSNTIHSLLFLYFLLSVSINSIFSRSNFWSHTISRVFVGLCLWVDVRQGFSQAVIIHWLSHYDSRS